MHPADIQARLKQIGLLPDEDVPVVEALLLLGALDGSYKDLASYQVHIHEMHDALNDEIRTHPAPSSGPVIPWRVERITAVLQEKFGYQADTETETLEDPACVNILGVIDRRCGLPVALGALIYDLAHKQHWPIVGLSFPGHFLLRMEQGAERVIIDPCNPSEEMHAGKLRAILKNAVGPKAELQHDFYNPVSPRDIVLRFCNNRKTRFLERADYVHALQTVTHELWIAPQEPRLYFDGGLICAKLGQLSNAIGYLHEFIDLSHDTKTVAEARELLLSLQRRLQ